MLFIKWNREGEMVVSRPNNQYQQGPLTKQSTCSCKLDEFTGNVNIRWEDIFVQIKSCRMLPLTSLMHLDDSADWWNPGGHFICLQIESKGSKSIVLGHLRFPFDRRENMSKFQTVDIVLSPPIPEVMPNNGSSQKRNLFPTVYLMSAAKFHTGEIGQREIGEDITF